MARDAEEIQRQLKRLEQSRASTTEGLVVKQRWDEGLVEVDVGGTVRPMSWAGPAPWAGDTVRVTQAGGSIYCELIQGAPIGAVQSVDSGIAVVLGDDDETYAFPYLGPTPAINDRVRIDHAGRVILGGPYSVEPEGSVYERPPAPPTPSRKTREFRPIDSANWYGNGGRWDSQFVDVSISRSGYYFYGSQIADTIPDSARIITATLSLTEHYDYYPGTPSLLGVHNAQRRPGGPPALAGATVVTGPGNIDILPFATALKTGSAYGVGFAVGGGQRRFGPFTESGTITISWED